MLKTPQLERPTMKRLKKGVKDSFYKNRSNEKRVQAFYLYEWQIERLKEFSDGKPSEFLRNILKEKLGDEE